MGRKKFKYTKNLPKLLYTYFKSYSEPGAPSFDKFAVSIGATLEELMALRKHKELERAWRECSEIRRDYLIDTALAKRQDSSLVRFLLCAEYGMKDERQEEKDTRLEVTVEVIGDEA